MRKANYYNKAIKLLQELHNEYPNYSIAQHIATAISDYGEFWGITDKEFCFALEKYQSELSLDIKCVAPEEYVERIVKDAETLFLEQEEDEDGDY